MKNKWVAMVLALVMMFSLCTCEAQGNGSDDQIGQMIAGAKRYFLQCFTDRDSVPFGGLSAPAKEDLETYAAIVRKYVPETQIRGVS